MRISSGLVLIVLSFFCFAQQKPIQGIVKDKETKEIIIGSHIQNLTSGAATTSSYSGRFTIPVEPGDTLLISNIGYQRLGWVAKESWFDLDRVEFLLSPDTIYLQEVVIGKLPEYQRFKQLIVETEPQDTSLQVFGLDAIDFMSIPMEGSPLVTEEDLQKGPSIGFTFDMDGLTKKGRERKKLQKLLDQKGMLFKAESKFNREWVAHETKLQGDKLTSFIAYCDFSPEFLAKTSLYIIHEQMMAKLNGFLAEYAEG